MLDLLENIAWHTLTGPHKRFASGTGAARRYARGFSPIAAFADLARPDFDALIAHFHAGEHFYCDVWSAEVSNAWRIDVESTMFKMYWAGDLPRADHSPDAIPLDARHGAQALALAMTTRPGPFGPRTIELGEYFGCFDGERLVAMAGERMCAGRLREISGVCTHPDYQGRGFARRLMVKLIRRQMSRDELPFLHVMRDNAAARRLYERMGFRYYHESVVRVIAKAG